jgi:hypothetical protein
MCSNIDCKRDSELAVCTAGGNELQKSTDLLKNEEQNFVEPVLGLSKVGKGVLEERGGI